MAKEHVHGRAMARLHPRQNRTNSRHENRNDPHRKKILVHLWMEILLPPLPQEINQIIVIVQITAPNY